MNVDNAASLLIRLTRRGRRRPRVEIERGYAASDDLPFTRMPCAYVADIDTR